MTGACLKLTFRLESSGNLRKKNEVPETNTCGTIEPTSREGRNSQKATIGENIMATEKKFPRIYRICVLESEK